VWKFPTEENNIEPNTLKESMMEIDVEKLKGLLKENRILF
jgi:hypothetical protein